MQRINLLSYALIGLDQEIAQRQTLRKEIVELMHAESDPRSPEVIQRAREAANVLRVAMGKKPRRRRRLTAAGRRKISQAMKERWRKTR